MEGAEKDTNENLVFELRPEWPESQFRTCVREEWSWVVPAWGNALRQQACPHAPQDCHDQCFQQLEGYIDIGINIDVYPFEYKAVCVCVNVSYNWVPLK